MPMIMTLSERIIALDAGQIIAEGSPESVRANPLAVSSYLGGDTVAIERSTFATKASTTE